MEPLQEIVGRSAYYFELGADLFLSAVCVFMVLLWAKTDAATIRVRTHLLRCVATQVRRPSRFFALSIALVGIGFMMVFLYRWNEWTVPNEVWAVLKSGLIGTVMSTLGVVVVRAGHRWVTGQAQMLPPGPRRPGPLELAEV